MEHLVRVQNEYDRQVLAWLRQRIGDTALAEVARRLAGEGKPKPYLSSICRALSIRPPSRVAIRAEARRADRAVGDRYLARIRLILEPHERPAH